MLTHINNHVELAKNRLTEWRKGKNKLINFIMAPIEQLQDIEDAAFEFYTNRWISTATGVLLDRMGAIVGSFRNGRSDLEYRAAIFTQIEINNAGGEPESIINAIRQLYKTEGILYRDVYPAGFRVQIESEIFIPNIKSYLESIAPIEVAVTSIIQAPVSPPFRFGRLVASEEQAKVRDDNGGVLEISDFNVVDSDGEEPLNFSIGKGQGNPAEGFGTIYLNRTFGQIVTADGVFDLLLDDGEQLNFALSNANEDYTVSEFGGKLGVAL